MHGWCFSSIDMRLVRHRFKIPHCLKIFKVFHLRIIFIYVKIIYIEIILLFTQLLHIYFVVYQNYFTIFYYFNRVAIFIFLLSIYIVFLYHITLTKQTWQPHTESRFILFFRINKHKIKYYFRTTIVKVRLPLVSSRLSNGCYRITYKNRIFTMDAKYETRPKLDSDHINFLCVHRQKTRAIYTHLLIRAARRRSAISTRISIVNSLPFFDRHEKQGTMAI